MAKVSPLFELEAWDSLIHTEDWRAFLKLLDAHKEYLQARVNEYLAAHEDRRAGEELAKLNDCNRIKTLITSRIKELQKLRGEQ